MTCNEISAVLLHRSVRWSLNKLRRWTRRLGVEQAVGAYNLDRFSVSQQVCRQCPLHYLMPFMDHRLMKLASLPTRKISWAWIRAHLRLAAMSGVNAVAPRAFASSRQSMQAHQGQRNRGQVEALKIAELLSWAGSAGKVYKDRIPRSLQLLHLRPGQIITKTYTHVHYAFGGISASFNLIWRIKSPCFASSVLLMALNVYCPSAVSLLPPTTTRGEHFPWTCFAHSTRSICQELRQSSWP